MTTRRRAASATIHRPRADCRYQSACHPVSLPTVVDSTAFNNTIKGAGLAFQIDSDLFDPHHGIGVGCCVRRRGRRAPRWRRRRLRRRWSVTSASLGSRRRSTECFRSGRSSSTHCCSARSGTPTPAPGTTSPSGQLIVNVSDERALEKATAAGADARLVKHSLRELTAIKAELDAAAGAPTDGAERRSADAVRDLGLSAWTVDPGHQLGARDRHRRAGRSRQGAAGRVRRRGHDRGDARGARDRRRTSWTAATRSTAARARPGSTCATPRPAPVSC